METTLVVELAKQAPYVVALLYLVITFLAHIRKSETDREVSLQKRDQALAELGQNCHQFQRELNDQVTTTVRSVQDTLLKTSETLGKATGVIERGAMICTTLEKKRPEHYRGEQRPDGQ